MKKDAVPRRAPVPIRITLASMPWHGSRRGGVAPIAAAAVTVMLWASAFVVVRASGEAFSPGSLALGRQLAGSLMLTIIVLVADVRRDRAPALLGGRSLLGIAVWGASWFGLYNLALNAAERHLDAGTASLLVNIAPVLVGVLAGLLLGEGFPGRLFAGLSVAFAGAAVIAVSTGFGADLAGVAGGIAAAALYAGGAVGQKRLLRETGPLTLTWLGCLAGTAVCAPFFGDLLRELAVAPPEAALGVLYLGVFPTGVAFLTWSFALSRMPAGRLASTTFLVPPLVVAMSWAGLGETPSGIALVGGVLCLTGVAIATRSGRAMGRARPRRRPGLGRDFGAHGSPDHAASAVRHG